MDYKSSLKNLDQNVTSISCETAQVSKIKDVDLQIPVVTATESNDVAIESPDPIATYMLPQKIIVRKYRLKK